MKTPSNLRWLLILVFGLVSAKPLFAQIAASQQFSSRQSINPATIALLGDSSLAYIQKNGTGETETVVSYEVEKLTFERTSVLGVLANDGWVLEAYTDLSHKEVIENQNNSGSSVVTAGIDDTTESCLRYVLLGINSGSDVNWGIKVSQKEESVEAHKITRTDLAIGLGITYKLIDNLHFGLGGNLVNNEDSTKVTNNRYDYYYGVSFGFKPSPATGLRFEANSSASPEDGQQASGNKAANNHRATSDTLLAVEFRYQQFKAAYQTRTYTISSLSTRPSENEDVTSTTTIGFGYVLDDPAIFFELFRHDAERRRGEYTITALESLELSVGILF